MLTVALFILALFILALLVCHSYAYRGLRFTTNFFILGFLWIFGKRVIMSASYILLKSLPSPWLNLIVSLIATCVWLTIFYIGWALAERIIKRAKYFKVNLFALLLLSSLIITSTSYCIEIILKHIGWWPWVSEYSIFGFMNNNSRFILESWSFFSRYFLLAFAVFFLIECSKYRRAGWKCLLVLLPFMQEWSFVYFGPLRPNLFIVEESLIFGAFFILSLTCPLSLEYCYDEARYNKKLLKLNSNILYLLSNIPFFTMLWILLIIFIIDIFLLKQPLILISAIPAIFFVLLCFDKIPLWLLAVLSLPLILFWKQGFILSIAPVTFILILKSLSFMKGKNNLMQ